MMTSAMKNVQFVGPTDRFELSKVSPPVPSAGIWPCVTPDLWWLKAMVRRRLRSAVPPERLQQDLSA